MKLLFCIPLMCGGGAERVMALLCNGLSARGHEVVLATDTKQESFYSLDKKIRLVSLYPDLAPGGNIFRKIYYNLFLLYQRKRFFTIYLFSHNGRNPCRMCNMDFRDFLFTLYYRKI